MVNIFVQGLPIQQKRRKVRFCRWANLIQKRCPQCFEWIAREWQKEKGIVVVCKNDDCTFEKSTEDITNALKNRDDMFGRYLNSEDIPAIIGTLKTLGIMIRL